MRKVILTLSGIALLLILAAALAVPYFIGLQVESRFDKGLDQLSDAIGIPIELTSYRRHWFKSRAEAEMIIDGKTVPWHLEIMHGPRRGLNIASLKGHPVVDDKTVQSLFDDEPPVELRANAPLLADPVITLSSPEAAGQIQDSHGHRHDIQWLGARGRIDPDRGLTLNVPKLDIQGRDSRLKLVKLDLKAQAPLDPSTWRSLPESHDFNADLSVRHFHLQTARDKYAGHGRLRGTLTPHDNGTLDWHSRLELADIRRQATDRDAPSLALDTLDQKLKIEGIQRKPLEKLLSRLDEIQHDKDLKEEDERREMAQATNQAILDYLPALLSGKPAFDWHLALRGEHDERLKGHVLASLSEGKDWSDQVGSRLALAPLISRLTIDTEARADHDMIRMLIQNSDEPEHLEDIMEGLASNGLLDSDDDQVKTNFYFNADKQKLKVNGHSIPSQLQMLIMSAVLGL